MKRFDVLVVGAGPAGATCAYKLAKGGAKVLLVDTRQRVGHPVQCAEFVPVQLSHTFPEFFPPRTLAKRVKTMLHLTPWGETVSMRSEGFVLHRSLWDENIANLAQKQGAQLKTKTKLISLTDGGAILKDLKTGEVYEVRADFVVGADGARSFVARQTGDFTKRFLSTSQLTLPLKEPLDELLIYFRDYIPGGYGWVFPKGDVANVGVGLDPSFGLSAREALSRFLSELSELVDTNRVLSRTGGFIPAQGVLKPVRGRVLLVGDAGGFCHPITGAGIPNAVLTGAMAGEALLSGNPEEYEEEALDTLGAPLMRAKKKRERYMREWDRLEWRVPRTWIAFPEYYED
ncbi:MAG: NAD(P)/FAD-dependent oxidoreductase [Aquificae bacterium]|nr:NAD(P)/FAD-dependent oxidoreductase [Aquificota bacterium]